MSGDRQDLRRALQRLAFSQAGYFTAAQAREVGYSYQAQKYHVDFGNWTRVDRALFRLPDWPASPDDTFVRWVLWSGGRAVVSHESALAANGLGDIDPATVHLTVPPTFHARDRAVVLHVAELRDSDVEQRQGWSLTTPQRSILDVAASEVSQEHVDSAVREAIDRGLVTARRLRSAADVAGDRAALRVERALAALATR
jgi:predicted transcriptional regulator of viral defense system